MRRILILGMLLVVLSACGGSGGGGGGAANGPAGDPVGAVTGFVNTIKAKAFDKLPPLVCAAQREAIVGGITGSSAGMPAALMDAITFDFQNLDAKQTTLNGDAAVVHVTGKLVTTVDAAKAKDAVKQLLGSQATDDQVNQMIAALGQSRDISEDVDVVKEGGSWVVCSQITGS